MAADSRTSLILPAYVPTAELHEVTLRCLGSLEATAESYQLVVVDNGSTVDAQRTLREAADLYIRKPEPIGYARAANIGLALADSDWLAVLNTDLVLRDGWLERLREDYPETPGGVLSAVDEDRPEEIIYDEAWFSLWLTHRSVIQEVGYFDESMGFRFHDQDYAIRVHRAGYRVMRDGRVRVDHVDSATYATMGRGDDPAERAILEERWGSSGFTEWINGQ